MKHYYSQTIRDVHALIILFRENVMLLQKTTKHILLFLCLACINIAK